MLGSSSLEMGLNSLEIKFSSIWYIYCWGWCGRWCGRGWWCGTMTWHPWKNEIWSSCSDYQLNFLFLRTDSDSTYLKHKSQNKPCLHDLKRNTKERKENWLNPKGCQSVIQMDPCNLDLILVPPPILPGWEELDPVEYGSVWLSYFSKISGSMHWRSSLVIHESSDSGRPCQRTR